MRFQQLRKWIKLNNANRLLSMSPWLTKQKHDMKKPEASSEPHCIFDMCAIKPGTPQPCVVIIGAGMSGLSAASRLVQCGITNFRVLEALDSPGGRMRTCWLGDAVAETGWSYLEGACLANTVFTLAAQERLLPTPLHRVEEEVALVLTSEGRAIDRESMARAKEIFADLESSAGESCGDSAPSPPTLGARLECLLKDRLDKLPKFERWDTARALYGLIGSLKTRIGQSLEDLSPDALAETTTLPGGKVRIRGGMSGLVSPLVRDLPQGAVVYCKPVHSILWGTAGPGAPRAVVKCCDGENYPADYVIVTVPLGVLKSYGEKMFCPELPAYKMEAVRSLGFGCVNKIFLMFESPFWVGQDGDILLSWSPRDLEEEKSWVKGVSTVEMVPGSNKVLGVTVSGAEASKMESLSDNEIADELSGLLQRFLGQAVLPAPTEMLRSSWNSSPYFSGFKTYLSKGSGRGMLDSLSRPLPCDCDNVPPIILFAGEHTHSQHFGTLHGSRLSGIREADRVIHLTKLFNGPPNKGPACIPCA